MKSVLVNETNQNVSFSFNIFVPQWNSNALIETQYTPGLSHFDPGYYLQNLGPL